MRVLVAYERSGEVRRAFRALGHEAFSCDLEDAEDGDAEHHLRGDVFGFLDASWDMYIAHPVCTYLCGSGLHWIKRRPERLEAAIRSAEEVYRFIDRTKPKPLAIENPVGVLSRFLRKPDQIIQPWQFGEDASKATCLWLRSLPLLKPTVYVAPRMIVDGKPRWGNQTRSGQNRLAPSPTRAQHRAKTYPGIARAFAEQWGMTAQRPSAEDK